MSKEKLVLRCPACDSDVIHWDPAIRKAYCRNCGYASKVDFRSDTDAMDEWNEKLKAEGSPLYPGPIEDRLDYIYDFVDYMMKSGQFDALDHMLLHLNHDMLVRDEVLGFLTATLPAKNKMPNGRAALLDLAKGMFIFEPEMLKGLE